MAFAIALKGFYRVFTRVLFTASSTAVMSTVVEFAMRAAQDRIAAAVVGTAGEAFIVARRMFALGTLAKRGFDRCRLRSSVPASAQE